MSQEQVVPLVDFYVLIVPGFSGYYDLSSVYMQNYPSLNLIVVDGGADPKTSKGIRTQFRQVAPHQTFPGGMVTHGAAPNSRPMSILTLTEKVTDLNQLWMTAVSVRSPGHIRGFVPTTKRMVGESIQEAVRTFMLFGDVCKVVYFDETDRTKQSFSPQVFMSTNVVGDTFFMDAGLFNEIELGGTIHENLLRALLNRGLGFHCPHPFIQVLV